MKNLIYICLIFFALSANAQQVVIKNKSDIEKIKSLNTEIKLEGPADPVKFSEFEIEMNALIEKHIEELLKSKAKKEEGELK